MAGPGEFTKRAFINGRLDLATAEGVADMIAASSRASQRLAMTQMKGDYSRRLNKLRDDLIQLAALLELELDFSEEDVEFASREKIQELATNLRNEITRLLQSYKYGSVLKEGIPTAIIGATNAGKSSLLNCLIGDDRAIVSDIHGTTRDSIEETLEIEDYLFRFIDTAGLRQTTDTIERIGIQRAYDIASNARIILHITDATSITKEITPEAVLKLYEALEVTLPGKVAVKVHSGEVGNQNFIRPSFWQPMIQKVNGTIVECNTASEGARNTTTAHWETMKLHGWTEAAEVDIMDEDGELELPIENGKKIRKNFVGTHMEKYDSLLVLSHFKGHPMGGFGGALKNISIGLASSHGKAYIHGVGNTENFWSSDHNSFLESMADAAQSIVNYFSGKIAYINVMKNMSVDCDCCAVAEDPKMADIGMLASLDPIALDQACVDLVYQSEDPGKKHLIERMESKNGIHTVEAAAELGFGSREYELVEM